MKRSTNSHNLKAVPRRLSIQFPTATQKMGLLFSKRTNLPKRTPVKFSILATTILLKWTPMKYSFLKKTIMLLRSSLKSWSRWLTQRMLQRNRDREAKKHSPASMYSTRSTILQSEKTPLTRAHLAKRSKKAWLRPATSSIRHPFLQAKFFPTPM